MPTHPEAKRLNIEFYRKQAKALLKSAQSGDSAALQRMSSTALALHTAQFAIAKEQGFASWPRFRAFLMQSSLNPGPFVEAALSDRKQAEEMLAAHPEIGRANLYTALVLGDWEHVAHFQVDVDAKGGPRDWTPLLYVCFSRYGSDGEKAETARQLLKLGADPNASYIDERWADNPLPCLYGATGLNNNPALALALLEGGANLNDSESLYHSTEHADLRCMRLLLERGASPTGTNALNHMLDREDPTGLDLLLKAGADPNERRGRGETSLHWAVFRGRSVRILARLLESGVEMDVERDDGRTAYAMAAIGGQSGVVRLLEERGANLELSPLDRFLSNPQEFPETPPEIHKPEVQRVISDLATAHRTGAVRALLNAGLPVDAPGDHGGTALHWACWKGYADLVQLLLEHGASLTSEDTSFQGTPPEWFAHGMQNSGEPDHDRPEIARLLLEAGAAIPLTGNAAVDQVLLSHQNISE